jgi:hypothetical protein
MRDKFFQEIKTKYQIKTDDDITKDPLLMKKFTDLQKDLEGDYQKKIEWIYSLFRSRLKYLFTIWFIYIILHFYKIGIFKNIFDNIIAKIEIKNSRFAWLIFQLTMNLDTTNILVIFLEIFFIYGIFFIIIIFLLFKYVRKHSVSNRWFKISLSIKYMYLQ